MIGVKELDVLLSTLIKMSESSDMSFGSLRGEWGSSISTQYNMNKTLFVKSIRLLAKRSPIKYFGGYYYLFTGRIYEPVDQEQICFVYEQLIEHIGIGQMMFKASVRKEAFLETIRQYNTLEPKFNLVAFSNGVVDLDDPMHPVFMDFSPDLHVLHYHPYDYDPKARCDRWELFLNRILPDKESRAILQMFLGLGLMQRGVAYDPNKYKGSSKVELCLLLVGSGANGKSVIFEVVRELFGSEYITSMDYDTLTADGDEGMRGRYPIRNAVFNWSSDSNPKKFGRNNTGMFKRIVSGEPVPFRKLGNNVEETRNLPYLVFALNNLPCPDDSTFGFIRRLQYISFDVTIPKSQQNPDLANILCTNELSGIFNWVLKGTQLLVRRRFRFPDARGSEQALMKTLLESAPVKAWLRAYRVRNEKLDNRDKVSYFKADKMYEWFLRFCRDNEIDEDRIPTQNMFGRTLYKDCNFYKRRVSDGVFYEVYGTSEEQLKQPVFITDMDDVEPEPLVEDDFIKGVTDDDSVKKE